jgi:hypothetical protein
MWAFADELFGLVNCNHNKQIPLYIKYSESSWMWSLLGKCKLITLTLTLTLTDNINNKGMNYI